MLVLVSACQCLLVYICFDKHRCLCEVASDALNGKTAFNANMPISIVTINSDNKRIVTRSFATFGFGLRSRMISLWSRKVAIPEIHQFKKLKSKT